MTVTDADVEDLLDGAIRVFWSSVSSIRTSIRDVIRYVLEQRAATKPEDVAEAAPADPPVGTIRCGDGLTAEQEAMSEEDKKRNSSAMDKAAASIMGFAWSETEEGSEFWSRIYGRIRNMGSDLIASSAPKPNTIEQAARDLLADVRRRYPGEALRCEHMIALDAAITAAEPRA